MVLPDGIVVNFALGSAADPRHAVIPLIMVTGRPTPLLWEKAASAGVAYVVNKARIGVRHVQQALRNGILSPARLN